MKKIYILSLTSFILVFFSLSAEVAGQRKQEPKTLVGADLNKAKEYYEKKVEQGVEQYMPAYADALLFAGESQQALDMYREAEAQQVELTREQQRNFSHLARRMGESSPYDQETGYFSTDWHAQIDIEPYCNNSTFEDFAPFYWNDLLFITSSRVSRERRNADRYDFTGQPFLNVYVFDNECRSVEVDFLPPTLKTDLHDGPMTIAGDTSLVVITRNYPEPNDDGVQNLYLGYYTREDGTWSEEMPVPFNDPAYNVQHPYFDTNTNTLYFSSDMPGGHGGFDLWSASWDGENWSDPRNLGDEVNSAYDEVFPSLNPAGDLIYATNHLETTGGLDLVMFTNNTRYLLPEPINTAYDDFGITYRTRTSGYLSSNRQQEGFNDNIYSFEIRPVPFVVKLSDEETGDHIAGAQINYRAEDPVIEGDVSTSGLGEAKIYEGHMEPFAVSFNITHDDYEDIEFSSDNFVFEDDRWVLSWALEPIPVEPEEVILEDGFFVVYFDNDRPDPNTWRTTTTLDYADTYRNYLNRKPRYVEKSANSRAEIEELFADVEEGMSRLEWFAQYVLEQLEQGHEFDLLFTSHTSPLAEEDYNMLLSERRFNAVKNYFQSYAGGALRPYFDEGKLSYEHNPYGERQASADVSSNPQDPSRSIYGVGAAKERRVTITWELISR